MDLVIKHLVYSDNAKVNQHDTFQLKRGGELSKEGYIIFDIIIEIHF